MAALHRLNTPMKPNLLQTGCLVIAAIAASVWLNDRWTQHRAAKFQQDKKVCDIRAERSSNEVAYKKFPVKNDKGMWTEDWDYQDKRNDYKWDEYTKLFTKCLNNKGWS